MVELKEYTNGYRKTEMISDSMGKSLSMFKINTTPKSFLHQHEGAKYVFEMSVSANLSATFKYSDASQEATMPLFFRL